MELYTLSSVIISASFNSKETEISEMFINSVNYTLKALTRLSFG